MKRRLCRPLVITPGVVLLIFSAATAFSATGVADAPTVPLAPLIDKPLPPPVADAPGERPSPRHVWVPGHWRWSEGAYVWEMGRWEIPPEPDVAWQPSQWVKQKNGYALQEGYWAEVPPRSAVAETGIAEPPPPPPREIIPERPTPAHVWLPGHWDWRDGRYEWVAGRWETPPRSSQVWVAPRWEQRDGRYVLVEGHWRDAVVQPTTPPPHVAVQTRPQSVVVPQPPPHVVVTPSPPQQIIVVTAPPPPRSETFHVRPSRHHVWVPGYWAWHHGHYVWITGYWTIPPRGYRTWIPPRWEPRGAHYLFIEGHWRR